MDEKEGAALLDELLAHQENPEFIYHHKWKMGDLMMWDNRCTNHRACGEVVQLPNVRRLHRATLQGEVPI
jgi:alpha-ketoglutarate-dependent taurine dioxygenase